MWKPVDSDLWRHNARYGCSLQQQCVRKQSRPMKHLDTSVAKGKYQHNVTSVSGTQFQLCWIWKVAPAQGGRHCCRTRLYTCFFIVPSSTTSSLSPPYWNPAHAMTDGLTLPSVPCTQTSICLSPCRLHTRARPSVWCNLNHDSSVDIQCQQWQRRHWCTKVSLGHHAGLQEWYPVARRCRGMH